MQRHPRVNRASRLTFKGLGIIAAGLFCYGVFVEPNRIAIREYHIPIDHLPPRFEGLRIVHLSDAHVGPYTSVSHVRRAVTLANRLNPDLVVLTGDYVHQTPRAIGPGIREMQRLRARLGVVGVLGNHDHWEGAAGCREQFHEIGIPLLDNKRLSLTENGLRSETGSETGTFTTDCLCLAGVGDYWENEMSWEKALGGASPTTPRLVLSHNPDALEELPRDCRVDLAFCGHTHGGQVRLPFLPLITPSIYGEKYAGGLCAAPNCRVIVSRGIGTAILPIRFGVPPEIVVVTLENQIPVARKTPG